MALAIVPARRGSKGVPGKNVHPILGRPLLRFTTDVLLRVLPPEAIYVCTDSPEYMELAVSWGMTRRSLRPEELGGDDVTMHSLLRWVLAESEVADYSGTVLLCQPTAPFRSSDDIAAMLRRASEVRPASVVSVVESDVLPTQMYRIDRSDAPLEPVDVRAHSGANRQTIGRYVRRNGSMFAFDSEHFRSIGSVYSDPTYCVEMPRERSIDINSQRDLDALLEHLRTQAVTSATLDGYLRDLERF